MVSNFSTEFIALTDLDKGVQAKHTVPKSREDGVEDAHQSGGVGRSGVIESEGFPGGGSLAAQDPHLADSSVGTGSAGVRPR